MSIQWETLVTIHGSSRAASGTRAVKLTLHLNMYVFLTKCTSKNRSRTKNTICAFMEGMKEQSEIARTNMNFRNKPQDIQPILNLQELMRKQ